MRALAGGGFLMRFLVSGVTAILVVSTLSLAISLFSGPAGMSGRSVAGEYDPLTILATEVAGPAPAPQTVHATALQNRDGSRTLLVVNDSYGDCAPVLIRFPASQVRKIVNDPVRKHQVVAEIGTAGSAVEHADVLSPMSLTVYTTAKGPVG